MDKKELPDRERSPGTFCQGPLIGLRKISSKGDRWTWRRILLYGGNESDTPASLRGLMNKPEEDELSEEKRKKEGYSIIVALIAVLIIGISFIWHLWSALFPVPTP